MLLTDKQLLLFRLQLQRSMNEKVSESDDLDDAFELASLDHRKSNSKSHRDQRSLSQLESFKAESTLDMKLLHGLFGVKYLCKAQ